MPTEKRMKEKINFMELLAPAGNYEKLLTAIYYGADAIYLSNNWLFSIFLIFHFKALTLP